MARVVPAISVNMSVYNAMPFLAEAIDSILNQTFTNFEFVIVNDGSSDDSGRLLDAYAKKDERIVVFHQSNQGIACARNLALEKSRADLIAVMDADDIAVPERLQLQLDYMNSYPEVAVLGGQFSEIDVSGKSCGIKSHNVRDNDAIKKALWTGGCPVAHPTVMMRRFLVLEVGGYRALFRRCVDFDLWLRLSERYSFSNLSEVLLFYRFHGGSITHSAAHSGALNELVALRSASERKVAGYDPLEGLETISRDVLQTLGIEEHIIKEKVAYSYYGRASGMLLRGNIEDAEAILKEHRRAFHKECIPVRAMCEVELVTARIWFAKGAKFKGLATVLKLVLQHPYFVLPMIGKIVRSRSRRGMRI